MTVIKMLNDLENIEGISAEYTTYINFSSEEIQDKLKELWKTPTDIEDAFIKRWTLTVQFKGHRETTDLSDWYEGDTDYKRSNDIDTY